MKSNHRPIIDGLAFKASWDHSRYPPKLKPTIPPDFIISG
jgi:hypothetical protein